MPKRKVKKSKYIFLFLRIAFVTGGIVWAVSRIAQEQRWSSFLQYFRRMNIWIFAGILCIFTLSHFIVAFRWWLLLRSQSIFIRFWAAVKLFFLGWFYNNFMPSSVGGDLIRAWYVTEHTDKKFEAALCVFVDRLIGLLTTLLIAVFFYTFFLRGQVNVISFSGRSGFLDFVAEHRWIVLWGIVIVAVAFCLLCLCKTSRAVLKKNWAYIGERGLKVVGKLKAAIIIYYRSRLTVLTVSLLTIFIQMLTITGFWVLGSNMGIEAAIKYYFVFFTLTWVVGAIPVSIGGAVVIEASLVFLFTQVAGIDEPAAWAIAMSQRAVWMLTSLPGAVIHLVGAHLPKEISIDYNKSIN